MTAMRKIRLGMLLLLFLPVFAIAKTPKKQVAYAIGFYNLENLFDTCHDAGKNAIGQPTNMPISSSTWRVCSLRWVPMNCPMWVVQPSVWLRWRTRSVLPTSVTSLL